MEKRISLAYPEWPITSPACKDAEWRWLAFFKEIGSTGYQKLFQPVPMIAATKDSSEYISTIALQKQSISGKYFGVSTYLCLTGEAAGHIAADVVRYAEQLEKIYDILPPDGAAAIILRPLLKKPADRSEDYPDIKPQVHDTESWYVDAIVEQIKNAEYPLDEEIFRENIELGFTELLTTGTLQESGLYFVST